MNVFERKWLQFKLKHSVSQRELKYFKENYPDLSPCCREIPLPGFYAYKLKGDDQYLMFQVETYKEQAAFAKFQFDNPQIIWTNIVLGVEFKR